MRFRFIHAADLHLDTPFEGVAQLSSEAAALLRDASLEAFDALVSLALERDAAFVLLAGDIYDGEQRGVRAQLRFLRGVGLLAENGVRTLVVHGNHDPLSGWSAVRRWPPEVTIFGSDEVVGVPVEFRGEQVATVYGLSYARRDVTENLSLRFPRVGELTPARGLRIGLLHCSVGDQPDHSPYSPCSLSDLRAAAIDYWALGHVHRAEILHEGSPWVVYPGDTQGRSPKPAETGAKGAMVVEVEGASVAAVEFVPLDSVRFVHAGIDIATLGEGADLGTLRSELLRSVTHLAGEHSGRALLVRAAITGRGPLHHELALPGAVSSLLDESRETLAGSDPPVWLESLRDQTRALIDLDVVRARDDFSSSLLALAEAAAGDPVRSEELVRLLSPVAPSAPADLLRRCGALPAEELPGLLEEAALLALESLEKESSSCG